MNISELLKIDKAHWAKIYVELNHWNIPKELNHIKPKWWDNKETNELYNKKHHFISPINRYIESIISEKDLLRESNKDRMTDKEFDKWYKNRIENNTENNVKLLKKLFGNEPKEDNDIIKPSNT